MTTEAPWYASRFTGLFTAFAELEPRAHDPDIRLCAGSLAPSGARHEVLHVGGAGLDAEAAVLGCVGEAIERYHTAPLATDTGPTASFARWPLAEPAVDPEGWVLFLPAQYALAGFPFRPFTRETECRWQAFRDARSGRAVWVPEDLAHLHPRAGAHHTIAALTSTGLSAGTRPDLALLRGVQEVIERDGVLGAWWESYLLEEHSGSDVLGALDPELVRRFVRPNLEYRFHRVRSPYSEHVTLVTLAGDDHEGFTWSTGSACRETLRDSFLKSMIEAVQGRHHARWVLSKNEPFVERLPESFVEHALYYTRRPRRLEATVLGRATAPASAAGAKETLATLLGRLGEAHPVLFRLATPPVVHGTPEGFMVLKVIVVGLQPLHGDHRLAHLGGPLWAPRTLEDFALSPPHPFA